jgi:alanine racemase
MYTHFATADTNLKKMNEQMALLKKVSEYAKKKGLDFIMHCANSAATIREAKTHFDAVRPGICLYGLEPFSGYEKKIKLKPLLTWKTKIALIKTLEEGATVSYGCTFTAPRKMQIAVLPIGYWDGYNRLLSNKGRVIIKDKYARVLGRVAMNMTMVDISSIKNAKVGDDVVLIGKSASKQVSADEMAGLCGTIGYEIVCDINQNIKRVYD